MNSDSFASAPDKPAIFAAQKKLLVAMIALRSGGGNPLENTNIDQMILECQVNLGDVAGALDTLGRLPNDRQSNEYAAIARAPVDRVDAAGRKLLEKLPDPYRQRAVACQQAARGDISGAIGTIGQISGPAARFGASCDAARYLIEHESKPGANRLLKIAADLLGDLPDDPRAQNFIQPLAELQTLAGDAQGAIDTVGRLTDEQTHQQELFNIARWQAGAGDFAGAKATGSLLINPTDLQFLDQYIGIMEVIVHAKAGDFVKARELAGQIKGPREVKNPSGLGDDEQTAIINIANEQAKAGDWPGAQETLFQIHDSLDKANLYLGAALSFARAGDADDMNRAIAAAMADKNKPKEYQYTSFQYDMLAAALAISGDANGAVQAVTEATPDALKRCQYFREAIDRMGRE